MLLCREVFQPALTGILQYTDVNALLRICHTDYMKKKKKLNASSTGKYNKESLLEARYSTPCEVLTQAGKRPLWVLLPKTGVRD